MKEGVSHESAQKALFGNVFIESGKRNRLESNKRNFLQIFHRKANN